MLIALKYNEDDYFNNEFYAKPDDKYRFVVVTKDNDINLVKDPYAKIQKIF